MRRRRLLAARGFWLSDAFEADSIKRRRGNVTGLVLWLLALINFVMEQHDVDRRIRSTNSSLTSSRWFKHTQPTLSHLSYGIAWKQVTPEGDEGGRTLEGVLSALTFQASKKTAWRISRKSPSPKAQRTCFALDSKPGDWNHITTKSRTTKSLQNLLSRRRTKSAAIGTQTRRIETTICEPLCVCAHWSAAPQMLLPLVGTHTHGGCCHLARQ